MTNRIVYLVRQSKAEGSNHQRKEVRGKRDGCTGRIYRETPDLSLGVSEEVRRRKGIHGEEEKQLEGAAVFAWFVGAVVRENRSPRLGRGRRSRFWGTRVKGAGSRAGTRRAPVPAELGHVEQSVMGTEG